VRERGHARVVDALGLQNHGKRIAAQGIPAEDVDLLERQRRHGGTSVTGWNAHDARHRGVGSSGAPVAP